jgi:hypothetical protein
MKLAPIRVRGSMGDIPFFFNLSRPVGKGYPNAPIDDVSFVQFCFAALASSSAVPTPADLKAVWTKINVTGITDSATQAGIDAWQADRRKRFGALFEVDGIVSVAPDGVIDYAKNTPYAIVQLNWILMMATPSIWPRLDKHTLATAQLQTAIRAAICKDLTA